MSNPDPLLEEPGEKMTSDLVQQQTRTHPPLTFARLAYCLYILAVVVTYGWVLLSMFGFVSPDSLHMKTYGITSTYTIIFLLLTGLCCFGATIQAGTFVVSCLQEEEEAGAEDDIPDDEEAATRQALEIEKQQHLFGQCLTYAIVVGVFTALAYMRFDSERAFPGPSRHCGLEKTHNRLELREGQNWIWIELHGDTALAKRYKWRWSPECYNIIKYDIVKKDWSVPCGAWCDKNIPGNFTFNEACAFGMVNDSHGAMLNPDGMPVLKACQKAKTSLFFHLTDAECYNVGFTVCILSYLIGSIRFTMKDHEALRKDKGYSPRQRTYILFCLQVSRATKHSLQICSMGLSMFIDIFTDFVGTLLFIAHGQPFFAAYVLMVMMQNLQGGGDPLGADRVEEWLISLKMRYPHPGFLTWKSKEVTEATASLLIMVVYILQVPLHDEEGKPNLEQLAVANFAISTISGVYGIFEGSMATAKLEYLTLNPDIAWQFDKQIKQFEENDFSFKLRALEATISKVAVVGTIAVMFHQTRNAPAAWRNLGRVSSMTSLPAICILIFLLMTKKREEGLNSQGAKRLLEVATYMASRFWTFGAALCAGKWYTMYLSREVKDLPMQMQTDLSWAAVIDDPIILLMLMKVASMWLIVSCSTLAPFFAMLSAKNLYFQLRARWLERFSTYSSLPP